MFFLVIGTSYPIISVAMLPLETEVCLRVGVFQ